jgi:hypothetical protein
MVVAVTPGEASSSPAALPEPLDPEPAAPSLLLEQPAVISAKAITVATICVTRTTREGREETAAAKVKGMFVNP